MNQLVYVPLSFLFSSLELILGRCLSRTPRSPGSPSGTSDAEKLLTQSSGLGRLSEATEHSAGEKPGAQEGREIPMPRPAQPPADTSVAGWCGTEKAEMDIFGLLWRKGRNKGGPGCCG